MILPRNRLHRWCGPAAFSIALFLLYIFFVAHRGGFWRIEDELVDWEQAAKVSIGQQKGEPFAKGQIHDVQPVAVVAHDEDLIPEAEEQGSIREDAHKLLHADDFLRHFDQVLKLPNVSFEEGQTDCKWPDKKKVNFQYGGNVEAGWGTNLTWTMRPWPQKMLDAQRTAWQSQVRSGFLPWKDHANRFEGRGIIIVGGSGSSIKRVALVLKKLALLDSKLPVEIHYWADEMTDEKRKLLSSLWPKIYFNDLAGSHNIYQSSYGGTMPGQSHYNLKTAAVINTRFAEPLLLDSDNIPVLAPDSLWDSDVYKEYGSIFWPDIARTRPDNPIWTITNTKCRMDEYEQESGQLLVDKRKFWYHLQLSAYMNAPITNADGTWKKESFYYDILLGDKDTFRFAWHALKTQYGKPSKFLTGVGTVSGPKKFYCGHSFLQYHPDGRPLFMHGGLLKTMQWPVMKWQREQHGGIFQAYKKSDFEEQHDKVISVHIGWDGVDYFPDKDKYKLGTTWCTFFPEIEAKPLEDLVPGFEKDFEKIGGYWNLDEPGPKKSGA